MTYNQSQDLNDRLELELSKLNVDWDNYPTLDDAIEQVNSQPQPCERQPGEPLERYRWFQIYVTLPLPRRRKSVAEIAGLKPNTRLIAKASHQWSWPQRIADADRPDNGFPALQKEWRAQLLRETAFIAQFTGLQDTSHALACAAIGKMDRAAARRCLGPLVQYQRGLLTPLEPRRKENAALKINERRLHGMVLDKRLVIADKLIKLQYEAVFGPQEWADDPIVDGPKRQTEEDPSETEPWRRQPDEPDQHFYWFQIYLSLQFLQSTSQVARMAGIRTKAALARIASKWRWQERAAAYDAHHDGDPLACIQIRLHLFHDRAYEAHLRGLLDATRAIEIAGIGSLDQSTARQNLTTLLRRQRSLLHSFWRQHEAISGKSVDDHRDLLLASLVQKKAVQMLREEEEEGSVMLDLLYGPQDGEE